MMKARLDALWSCLLTLAEQIAKRAEALSDVPEITYCTIQLGETTAVAIDEGIPPAPGSELISIVLEEICFPLDTLNCQRNNVG